MAAEPEGFDLDAAGELPLEYALARLPAGRHGLPRSFILRNQRLRIVAAMLQTLPRRGYPGLTIADLTREAGVSRAAFYEQFEGKEACFLATYDIAAGWLRERIELAAAAPELGAAEREVGRPTADNEEWGARVAAGAAEALRLLGANPALAHLIAVDSFQAGPAARRRQEACLAELAAALRDGRPGAADSPAELEELLLGGVIALIGRYVDGNRADRLPEATPELVEYLLVPYLGIEEARRIKSRAA